MNISAEDQEDEDVGIYEVGCKHGKNHWLGVFRRDSVLFRLETGVVPKVRMIDIVIDWRCQLGLRV